MCNFRFEAVKISPNNMQTILACVSRLSFVSLSLALDVRKIGKIHHNYSLASGRLSRTKQQICQCLNSVDSAVSGRFVDLSSVYAMEQSYRMPRSHRTSGSSL